MANYFVAMVLIIMVLVVAKLPTQAEAALSCGSVAQSLAPCLNYIRTGGAGTIPDGCCTGIRSLNNAAQTTPDRQAVCGCLKSAAQAMPGGNIGLASSIPPKCGVNIPYKLDPSTDCSKVR